MSLTDKENNNQIRINLLEHIVMEKSNSVNFNGGVNQNKTTTIIILDILTIRVNLLDQACSKSPQDCLKVNLQMVKNKVRAFMPIIKI